MEESMLLKFLFWGDKLIYRIKRNSGSIVTLASPRPAMLEQGPNLG